MRTNLLLFLLTLMLIISCNKENVQFLESDTVATANFFPDEISGNKSYAPIVEYIKANDPSGALVKKLKTECGQPLWEKTASTDEAVKNTNPELSQASSQRNGRILILPFVRDSLIKSVLICEIDNKNRVTKSKIINSKEHKNWVTRKSNNRTTANELAALLLEVNHRVFGFKFFKLNDNRIFSGETNFDPSKKRQIILRNIKYSDFDQQISVSTEDVWITNTVCVTVDAPCSGDLVGAEPGSQTNNVCTSVVCFQWQQLLQDEYIPDPVSYSRQGNSTNHDLFSSGSGGSDPYFNPVCYNGACYTTSDYPGRNEGFHWKWWEDGTFLQPYNGINFGNWAINYLSQNSALPFSTFQNWFFNTPEYKGGEEVIDPDQITYDQPFQQIALPPLSDFETHFPKIGNRGNYIQMSSPDVYQLVGGSLYQSHLNNPAQYSNACAVRGSRAVLYSGIDIPVLRYNNSQRTQKGDDNKNYILDAISYNKFMIDKFGDTPYKLTGVDANDPQKVADLLKGKNGIYVIINNNPSATSGAGYSGHVDLILNGNCIGGAYTTPTGGVKSIRVWVLN